MSSDPNKKSARTFQCRDVLWETFEQMARELECSVDYLINEAMKQYARSRSYGSRTPFPGRGIDGPPMPPSSDQPGRPDPRTAPLPPPMAAPPSSGLRGSGGPLPPPPGRVPPPPGRPGGGMPLPPPPRGAAHAAPHGGMGMPSPPQRSGGPGLPPVPGRSAPPPPGPPRSVPPPLPRAGTPMPQPSPLSNGFPAPAAHGGQLHIIYQGEKLPVTKDRFVIGRGKQSSDLTLKDPNVSRQHAMIEFQNGVYFMVDMGSTNGVEYNGQRIARKQIGEGDIFKICDHDLIFTYR
jgi:hypothetical protein